MELWLWLAAIAMGLFVLILALLWSASRGVLLAKRLKPFSDQIAEFSKGIERYPEAVKFYSELAQSPETSDKKPRGSKG